MVEVSVEYVKYLEYMGFSAFYSDGSVDAVAGLFTVAGGHDRRVPGCPLPGMEEREPLEMDKSFVYGFGELLSFMDCLAMDEKHQHGLSGAVFISIPMRRAVASRLGD